MEISKGIVEDGTIVGNTYDKYGSRNPIVRRIMMGFTDALSAMVVAVAPTSIHEVGCGEGYWVLKWNQQGIKARGSDFSEMVISIACSNAQRIGLSPNIFTTRSIYDIDPARDSADLIVCCEVLEHLEDPEIALIALQRVANNYVILSVPREPIWRILNLLRGKYLTSFGNTPGHVQHWSSKKFFSLVNEYFKIVERKNPLPWTMLLCQPRS